MDKKEKDSVLLVGGADNKQGNNVRWPKLLPGSEAAVLPLFTWLGLSLNVTSSETSPGHPV